MPAFKSRLLSLGGKINSPILIKKKENLYYLTGRSLDLHADEYLLVKPKRINTDNRRMDTDVVAFGHGLEKIGWAKKVDRLKNIGKYVSGKNLDIEYGFTYGEGKYIKLKGKGVRVKPNRSPVDVMRQVKDADELLKIRKSMQIVAKVFALVKKELMNTDKRRMYTEVKLAQFIQSAGLKMGAEDVSFPAIVASGANAAIPHHVPSTKKLKAGESIIIDFGFKYKHYCSDFTRTVFLKFAPKKLANAYNQTEKAYNESMSFVSSRMHLRDPLNKGKGIPRSDAPAYWTGRLSRNDTAVTGNDVYQKSVDVLSEKKLDKYFIHSLGHGTGLEIHELPNLSLKSKDILKDGMVFSIEPGVYFPKVGGIRIEDLVYLEGGKVKKFINVSTKLGDNIL